MKEALFKSILLFLSLLLAGLSLQAQFNDANWVIGYGHQENNLEFGNSFLIFEHDTLILERRNANMDFRATTNSMSDSLGNLIYYSNNIALHGANTDTLFNGSDLNPSPFTDDYLDDGYNRNQVSLSLPYPGNSNLFYYVHVLVNRSIHPPYTLEERLLYSLIELNGHQGEPKVIHKNQVIYQDTFTRGGLVACKHANGRDWWIIKRAYGTNEYFKFLLDPSGFRMHHVQSIGDNSHSTRSLAKFSPNGKKYIRRDIVGQGDEGMLSIFDFNTSTGVLDLVETISNIHYSFGLEISPNNRWLYLIDSLEILQYDLEAPSIKNSSEVVSIFDGFRWKYNGFTLFYQMQLALDGKIYISVSGSAPYLHIIEYPNQKGIYCNVRQHGIELPTVNFLSIPYFPNYRSGPLNGSISDTLDINLPAYVWAQPNSQDVCGGDSTYFEITATGTDLTYAWQVKEGLSWRNLSQDGIFQNVNAPILSIKEVNSGIESWQYRCIVKNDFSSDTSMVVGLTISKDLPQAEFSHYFNQDSIMLVNESTNANIYTWNFGDNNESNEDNPFHVYYTISDTFDIQLIARNACGSQVINKTVFLPQIKAKVVTDLTTVCKKRSYTELHDVSFPWSASREWYCPSSNDPYQTTRTAYLTYDTLGKYDVQLSVRSASGFTDTLFLKDYINVIDTQAVFSFDTSIVGTLVEFTCDYEDDNAVYWYFDEDNFKRGLHVVHDFKEPGTYSVKLKVLNACGWVEKDITIIIEETSSVWSPNISKEKVNIFPNPAREFFNLKITNVPFGQYDFYLFDVHGVNYIEQKVYSSSIHQIRVHKIPTGVYFWQINKGEKYIQSGRLIIQ